jgi:hypothetical protein
MATAQVEYVGFGARATCEYTLRVRSGSAEQPVEFIPAIPRAFVSRRVRYEDAPEISFLKLHQELLRCADGLSHARLLVTDDRARRLSFGRHAPRAWAETDWFVGH